ncbi:MAG: hypothetical protein AABY83_13820 [Pseudomonadota bacterium]
MRIRHYVLIALLCVSATHINAAQINTTTEFTPLAAHYIETLKSRGSAAVSNDWYLVRRANQVETSRNQYSEVWQRDARGELTLTRVFHQDHKLIQYTPGELRTQRREKDWETLNRVVPEQQLTTLKHIADLTYLGRPASRYTGQHGAEKLDVIWLTHEALAAKIVHTNRDQRTTLALKELRPQPATHWPQANPGVIEPYDFIDGADLGDMEYDPFVRRVLDSDGH